MGARLLAIVGSAVLLVGTQALARAPLVDDTVSYELASWGRPISHWVVKRDGSGEIWKIEKKGSFRSYEIQKFHMKLPRQAYRSLREIIDPLQSLVAPGVPCAKKIYDLAYGNITWRHAGAVQAYRFDHGCHSDKADYISTQAL